MDVHANGIRFHCRVEGPEGAPWVMLSNSLAITLSMWDGQAAVLAERYRVLRYDQRGHGRTEASEGAYSFELLADDAAALMDAFEIARCRFVGLSMGGMMALGLARDHGDRRLGLAGCNSRAEMRAPALQTMWAERIETVKAHGMAPLVEPTVERWFTAALRAKAPPFVEEVRAMIRATPAVGYIGCAHALKNLDYVSRLGEIALPALFIAGAQDTGTPPEGARAMHAAVAGSRYVELDPAAHLSNLEQPAAFNEALLAFLASLP